jgi:O-glycosyl hydrolase
VSAETDSQWNMVLDETGMSGWGWSQCSPVTIDHATKTVIYEGSYWATKHYSYYVEANATVLLVKGAGNDACVRVNGACGCAGGCSDQPSAEFIAFRNPNDDVVVLAQNKAAIEQPVNMVIDGKLTFSERLPPLSMNTFLVEAGSSAIQI